MRDSQFNLEEYLTRGVEKIVGGIIKSTLKNGEASRFMFHYAKAAGAAIRKRHEHEINGEHIPAFLIASITSACNLHCAGCYARAVDMCFDGSREEKPLMSTEDWDRVFGEAEELGVSFVILAGGEPMLRKDVLEAAGHHRNILFPVITNGTLIGEELLVLLTNNPNLLPVISVEGDRETTDSRRGEGVYDNIEKSMEMLNRNGILYGTSVTVTKDNLEEVTGEDFVSGLRRKGCKAIIYIEYVPTNELTRCLAPDDEDREKMKQRIHHLREAEKNMMFISFPGDEKEAGGCLAAGRGFFHINPFGAVEPCPFSSFSDTDVRRSGLLGALKSPLFHALEEGGLLAVEHTGGCVLYEREEQVRGIWESRQ
ncbi:MAG: radical SAM/SPASM domain-containing protein [Lentihominibacter sp.]